MDHKANVHFGDNALGEVIGFYRHHNGGDDMTIVGYRQPRYVWRPTRGLADCPVHVNTWWGSRSTTRLARSVDGTVSTASGNLLYDGRYGYRNLPRADTVADPDDTDVYRPLEKFWEDVVHAGKEIRVYPDRASTTASTAFEVGYWASEADASDEATDVGPFAAQVGRAIHPYDGLWDVDFALIKNV
jgi:hypothetical protein